MFYCTYFINAYLYPTIIKWMVAAVIANFPQGSKYFRFGCFFATSLIRTWSWWQLYFLRDILHHSIHFFKKMWETGIWRKTSLNITKILSFTFREEIMGALVTSAGIQVEILTSASSMFVVIMCQVFIFTLKLKQDILKKYIRGECERHDQKLNCWDFLPVEKRSRKMIRLPIRLDLPTLPDCDDQWDRLKERRKTTMKLSTEIF